MPAMSTKARLGVLAAVLVATAVAGTVLLASNAGWISSPFSSSPSSGSLAVAVHDAPCDSCAHVWVTFTAVAVHEANVSGSGWTTLAVTGQTVDLEALNGSALAKVIGVLTLAPGHYEQIRLTVTNVVVGWTGGTNVTARIAGNGTAHVVGQFPVVSGKTTMVSIDIDLATSVHMVTPGSPTFVFTPRLGSAQIE